MVPKRILEVARATALASKGTGKNRNFKVGAVLFKGKKLVAAKSNSYKTHPLLSPYTNYPCLHAESYALISHGLDNCEGLDLLAVRVRKSDGELVMAMPCKVCQEVIKEAGIRHVYYTNWKGEVTHGTF
jgi:deoxycytidylate deaminase